MTKGGLLIHKGFQYSHNPNFDLSKLLKWVQQNGHLFTKDVRFNEFGRFYDHLHNLLKVVNTSPCILDRKYPCKKQVIPKAVYQDTIVTDALLVGNDNSAWVKELNASYIIRRNSLENPPADHQLRRIHAHAHQKAEADA